MVIGSLMLFEKGGPFLKLSLSLVLPAVLITALFFVLTLWLALRAYRRRPATGAEGLVGQTATASTDVGPQGGQVLLHGEIWSAYSDSPVPKGSRVKVQAVEGLKLKVRPEKD
jgi:membrane-bound serine protease (ClpP class)